MMWYNHWLPVFYLMAQSWFAGSDSPNQLSHEWSCGHSATVQQLSIDQRNLLEKFELDYQRYFQQFDQMESAGGPYILPVVFHIIHNGGLENISDNQIRASLDMLNASFANQGYYDQNTGVHTQIQFCLAKQDPDGNTSNGIVRVASPLTYFNMNSQDLQMKNLSRWDPTRYVNIWVVQEITSNMGSGVAGYAFFPTSHGQPEDGVVVEARYVGDGEPGNSVVTHELGHYLGLYHTFQGGCVNGNCMADGDRVCDTPPDQTTARPPCDQPNNSCSTDTDSGLASDEFDMIYNYMDYSDLACYSAFTQGQTDRMSFTLEQIRSSLLDSKGCDDPCPVQMIADATTNGSTFYVGDQIMFVNASTNASTYRWYVNDVQEATTPNFDFLFSNQGEYVIRLEIQGVLPECSDQKEWTFQVECEAQALFQVNQNELEEGDLLVATNGSIRSTGFRWLLNGVEISSAQDLSRAMNSSGIFELVLIASNGRCDDTSASVIITVVPPGQIRSGLPGWPILQSEDGSVHLLDWRGNSPVLRRLTSSGQQGFKGQSGAAYDECGGLKFVVVHNGSSQPNGLYVFDSDGQPLWDDNHLAPAMNAVRGGNEIQVVPVPERESEWYIIYNEYLPDATWPLNNAAYAPHRILYSHVSMINGQFVILQRDQVLAVGGRDYTYTDGKAVSRTAHGRGDQHFLYATRRAWRSNTLSLDRFLITRNGINFDANTGEVAATWWDLSMAGSPVELSPTEDKIAVVNRNQSRNYNDVIIFDAASFTAATSQTISLGELRLQPDGQPRDQSAILNSELVVGQALATPGLPLQFLVNMERKVGGVEFSPNGRFLYFSTGGFVSGSFTNLTYIGQIDLASTYPYELRLQIQQVPYGNHNPTSGMGCGYRNNTKCLEDYRGISYIESCFDGNLYFTKRSDSMFYVIPNPNDFMPQNLIPGHVDLSTPSEPNIPMPFSVSLIPDQIDGFNYLEFRKIETEVVVQKLDCDSLCDSPYYLDLIREDSVVIEQVQVDQCPDTLLFCVDTNFSYTLMERESGIGYHVIRKGGVVLYPDANEWLDYSVMEGCIEICGNGVDDDNDGLIDCDDPDIQDDCCCLEPEDFDLGPDREVCDNGIFVIEGPKGYSEYRWQDGFDEKNYTAFDVGLYILTVTDSCGNEVTDSLEITLIPESELDMQDLYRICPGDSILFQKSPFGKWRWSPGEGISCDTCTEIYLAPDSARTYIVSAEYSEGCYTYDTIHVEFLPLPVLNDTIAICPSDSIYYRGQTIRDTGFFQFHLSNSGDCDSLIQLQVLYEGENQYFDTVQVCQGDSAFFRSNWYAPGLYEVTINSSESCDSVYQLQVIEYDSIVFEVSTDTICPGTDDGSIVLNYISGPTIQQIGWSNGQTGVSAIDELMSGVYQVEILDENGCISQREVIIAEYQLHEPQFETENPLCYDDTLGQLMIEIASFSRISINQRGFVPIPSTLELEVGSHDLIFQTKEGCEVDTQVVIDPGSSYQAWIVDTVRIKYGDTAQLLVNVDPPGIYSYDWEPCGSLSCCDCPDPQFIGLKSQRLRVTITDEMGCERQLVLYVEVILDKKVWAPNVFSPNDDGLNDGFILFGNDDVSAIVLLEIYDRWGELVYRGNSLAPNVVEQGWDGRFRGEPMNPAVFTYIAKVRFIDGAEEWLTGSLTLTR